MAYKKEERWNEQFQILKRYLAEEGSFPMSHVIYEDVRLGLWFQNQKYADKKGVLPANRKELLESLSPSWNGSSTERKAAKKNILIASNWKKHLQPGDVAIDQALSGDVLYESLCRGIYSCQAYIDAFDERHCSMWEQFSDLMQRKFPKETAFFDLSYRKAVFEAQFPNLDFSCFNIYIDTFSCESTDLFTHKELFSMDTRPSYFDAAKAMSAYSQFKNASEMCKAYSDLLISQRPGLQNVVYEKYVNGKSDSLIAEEYNVSLSRVHTANSILKRFLRFPAHRELIAPKHPQDRLKEQNASDVKDLDDVTKVEEIDVSKDAYLKKTSIDELDLSVRSFNTLKRANINTLFDLTRYSESQLISLRNMGRKCLEEIQMKLADHGLELYSEPGKEYYLDFQPDCKKKGSSLDAQIQSAKQKSESRLAGSGKVRTPIASER